MPVVRAAYPHGIARLRGRVRHLHGRHIQLRRMGRAVGRTAAVGEAEEGMRPRLLLFPRLHLLERMRAAAVITRPEAEERSLDSVPTEASGLCSG
jgi:hypothetical protein